MTSSVYDTFRLATAHRPDDPAFTFLDAQLGSITYTYGQLFAAVEAIAEGMIAHGLSESGAPLGLLLRSQEEQVLHYLAGLRAKAVPAVLTPPNRKLNREYYARTTSEVLRRSRFAGLVTDVDLIEIDGPVFQPRTLEPADAGGAEPRRDPPRDASFLQFSSGTTGIKRGVLVTDDALLAQLRSYGDALGVTPEDTILSWLPLYHDMGFIACLNLPVFLGVHTVMIEPMDWVAQPSLFPRAASTFGATLSWNPNFAYAFMAGRIGDADLAEVDLTRLRALVNCSEPTTHGSQEQFLRRFGPFGLDQQVFKGCYAMAETTFALTHGEPTWPHARDEFGAANDASSEQGPPRLSVGRPLPGVEIEVRNSEGQLCDERQIGRLWVRSPFNFSGYFRDEEATAEAFDGDWYHTGDLGYRVDDALFVTGRSKDVLIVGGVNVFPEDLEREAAQVEGIVAGRVAAFSQFDDRLQTERIVLLAETELVGGSAMQAVLEVRQRILASFQIANFDVNPVPPGWLIKSSSGKVARSANQDKWRTEASA